MHRIVTFILLFFIVQSSRALIITGSAPEYKGKKMELIGFTDLITFRQVQLATSLIDEHGLFQIEFEPEQTGRYFLRSGQISAPIFLEPKKNLVLYFPGPDKTQPITAGFTHMVNVTFDTTQAGLNLRITRFNRETDRFLEDAYPLLIQRKAGKKVSEFVKQMLAKHGKDQNEFFRQYVVYALGNVEQLAFTNEKELFRKYLLNKPILYRQPEYMNFFNQYFDNYLPRFALSPSGYRIKELINKGTSAGPLLEIMKSDTLLESPRLRELVLLKGLLEMYHNKEFLKEGTVRVLKDLEKNSAYAEHRLIAASILHVTAGVDQGSDLPSYNFTDVSGKKVSTNDMKGRPTLYYFWSSRCTECIREFSVIKSLEKKYPGVNFVFIGLDDDIQRQKKVYQEQAAGGVKIVGAGDFNLHDKFWVWSAPVAIVTDSYGRIIANPAPLPSEGGLDRILFEAVK